MWPRCVRRAVRALSQQGGRKAPKKGLIWVSQRSAPQPAWSRDYTSFTSSSSNSSSNSSNNGSVKMQQAAGTVQSAQSASVAALETGFSSEFLQFINASRSAFAAVAQTRQTLLANGFEELSESHSWQDRIRPSGKYFFTRNQSTIAAFTVGAQVSLDAAQPPAFVVAAAHTDSPCLKIKPISNISKFGAVQVGVECYGGGLWHTYFDRDLGLSGRVLVRQGDAVVSRLLTIHEPLLRIPNLAIHLDRSVSEAFKFNTEEQLVPVLASLFKAELNKQLWATAEKSTLGSEHSPLLLSIIAERLQVPVEDIFSFELSLCDAQDSVLGGALKEFIFSGRLDNLMMSWCCTQALLRSSSDANLASQNTVSVAVLFDNEEVGSASTMGADSSVLEDLMRRVAESLAGKGPLSADASALLFRNSFLLSCDMAHAIHPNYSGKHECNHRPLMHAGLVVKQNANQRYATSAESYYFIKSLASQLSIPIQQFVVRNDSPCGSTIGPILAARLGMRCCDVGIPQLSMHSIREQAATTDLVNAVLLIEALLKNYSALKGRLVTDLQ